jgi:hypothetical protein
MAQERLNLIDCGRRERMKQAGRYDRIARQERSGRKPPLFIAQTLAMPAIHNVPSLAHGPASSRSIDW